MSDIQDEIFYGAILDENTISPKDYILGGDSDLSVKLKLVPINLAPTIQYNQRLVYESRNFCTIYSAMGMLGDIKNVTFTNEQILEVGRLGVAAGWLDPNSGGFLFQAIDEVRNWWNRNNPNDKVISFRVNINSPEFLDAIDLGYSIQVGYRTSPELYKDAQDDGRVTGTIYPKVGGHAVRARNGMLHIVDNYQGRKVYNEYDIVEFKELLANGIIFGEGYIYLNYNTMIFSDISENSPFYEAIKWCKDNGVTKGYEDGSFKPNQPITRGEMAQMLFNASKIK